MISRLLDEYATDIGRALETDDELAVAYLLLTANSLRNLAEHLRDEAPQPLSRGSSSLLTARSAAPPKRINRRLPTPW